MTAYRRKPPPIPYDILRRLQNECPVVTSGVLNIVLIWIARNDFEPFPEDVLETLSAMRPDHWRKYKHRVIEQLNSFYKEFVPYWIGFKKTRNDFSKCSQVARKKLQENRLAKKLNVASLESVKLADTAQSFSHQPHKLERIHEERIGDPPKEIVLPPLARRKSPSTIEFKPGLKDV